MQPRSSNIRPVGARIVVDGRTVMDDRSSISVYSLLKILTDRALTLERERQDLEGATRIEITVFDRRDHDR